MNQVALAIRQIGNRFRRLPDMPDNIFVDMENVRYLQSMKLAAYFAHQRDSGTDMTFNFEELYKSEQDKLRAERRENVAYEMNKLVSKYNLVRTVQMIYESDEYSEQGSFYTLKEFVDRLDSPLSPLDKAFISDLSKSGRQP